MKKGLFLCTAFLISLSGAAMAQDYEYHPALSDNFNVALGAFWSDNAFRLSSSNLEDIGENIDFGDSIGVDQDSTLFNGQLRWNFGHERKWSLSGQYFKNSASGDAILTEDVEWQDIIFREGTFVGGGVSVEVIRLFLGRSFVKNAQNDFGVGVGIHNLDLSAYIEGEVLVNDESTGFERAESSKSQILPNIGTWYNFSPAKNWLIHGRVDWISANVGDYDGTMWNANVGVGYQAWRHVGFDLSYQYFDIDLKVDKADWRGEANMRYSGPVVAMTFNW